MPRGRSFNEMIVDIATSAPPPGREEWARAMRAEFEALEGARTGWALGCLGAAARWRLAADWGYVLVLLITAALSPRLLLDPLFWAFRLHLVPTGLTGPVFQYGRFLVPAIVCLAFAAMRPGYWMLVGLALPLTFVSLGVIETAGYFHSSIWDVHPFNATLEVGMGAQLGYCLIGALIGRSLGSARAERSAIHR